MKTILSIAASAACCLSANASAALVSYTFTDVFTYGPFAGTPFTFQLSYDTALAPAFVSPSATRWDGSFGKLTAATGTMDLYSVTVADLATVDRVTFEGLGGSIVFEDQSASTLSDAGLPTAATLSAFPDLLVGFADARGGGGLYVGSPSSVPEPATWAMMVVGFGVAACAVRRPKAIGGRNRRRMRA